jgi:uncharacterized protein YbjT (DUF2867 family)
MYVIIGATGHTGTAVAHKLLAQGKKVRAVARNADHLASLVSKGAEPFAGNITDKNTVTKALAGAKAVYLMFPPDVSAPDFYAYQDQLTDVFASAIEKNGVMHAVTLSSIGADKPDKTGPILGMHRLEERLNRTPGLNTLHVRAANFMENTLGQADAIAQMGYAADPARPELKFPMVAAHDVGAFVGDVLSRLDFTGHNVQEVHGQRDLSYAEITAIIGRAIGKPDLKYATLTREQFSGVLMQIGMSKNTAKVMVEMADAMDSGYIKPLEARSPRNTTPTSYETFVAQEFLPYYQSKRRAA